MTWPAPRRASQGRKWCMGFGVPAANFRRLVWEVSRLLAEMDRPDVTLAFREAAKRVRGMGRNLEDGGR